MFSYSLTCRFRVKTKIWFVRWSKISPVRLRTNKKYGRPFYLAIINLSIMGASIQYFLLKKLLKYAKQSEFVY